MLLSHRVPAERACLWSWKENNMKGRRFLVTFLTAFAVVCILSPSVAQAANTTCANADFLFLGERAQYNIASTGSLFFKARVTANRSYAILAWGPFQDVSEGGVDLNVTLYSDNSCTTGASGVDPTDYEPLVSLPSPGGHVADHDNLIPPADGVVYIQVANNIGAPYLVHVLIIETTLFSPWWFTGGTNQAFIEIRNNMNEPTTPQITLYASNGLPCGTVTDRTIPGNGNMAISVNSTGSCASALSGSAQIAFAGTPGGLTANTTTLDVPNGTSFDSPFTPRMVWSTFSR
jgi:hypothetical protein